MPAMAQLTFLLPSPESSSALPHHKLFHCSPLKGGEKYSFSSVGIFLCIYQLYVPFIAHIILVESLSSDKLMYEAKV